MTDRTFTALMLAALFVMLTIAAIAAYGARMATEARIRPMPDINRVLCEMDPSTCEVGR